MFHTTRKLTADKEIALFMTVRRYLAKASGSLYEEAGYTRREESLAARFTQLCADDFHCPFEPAAADSALATVRSEGATDAELEALGEGWARFRRVAQENAARRSAADNVASR